MANTLISAGEIPLILEACPNVSGWYLLSFSLDSYDKDCIV